MNDKPPLHQTTKREKRNAELKRAALALVDLAERNTDDEAEWKAAIAAVKEACSKRELAEDESACAKCELCELHAGRRRL